MQDIWDIQKIEQVLPQRFPFLFIDKVLEINNELGRVTCLKHFTINECFFRGHFPGNPVVPGAIIIETLAQASIILYAVLKPDIAKKKPDYYIGKVEAKFFKPVRSGDCLIAEVNKEKVTDKGGIVSAFAKVGDNVAAQAAISFGVKIKNAA